MDRRSFKFEFVSVSPASPCGHNQYGIYADGSNACMCFSCGHKWIATTLEEVRGAYTPIFTVPVEDLDEWKRVIGNG